MNESKQDRRIREKKQKANTRRLERAAPDLLAACEDAIRRIDIHTTALRQGKERAYWLAVTDTLRAATAKARATQPPTTGDRDENDDETNGRR